MLGLDDHLGIKFHYSGHALLEEDLTAILDFYGEKALGIVQDNTDTAELTSTRTTVFSLEENWKTFFNMRVQPELYSIGEIAPEITVDKGATAEEIIFKLPASVNIELMDGYKKLNAFALIEWDTDGIAEAADESFEISGRLVLPEGVWPVCDLLEEPVGTDVTVSINVK
jgi:hypothetical protein